MRRNAPRTLLVGPVTIDTVDGRRAAGGPVSYAARAAQALGQRLAILTIGGPDAPLEALAAHDVECLRADATLRFELSHGEQPGRSLRVPRPPGRTLTAADLPQAWRQPRLLLLAPLLPGDIDLGSFLDAIPTEQVGLLAQGLQRRLSALGLVEHLDAPSDDLLRACSAGCTVFLSEEETAAWSSDALHGLVARRARVVVTRGAAGADVYAPGRPTIHVDATPAAPIDTTGSGDVFAAVFMLALSEGDERAGRLASAYAAAATEVLGPAPLPPRAAVEARMAAAGASPRAARGAGTGRA